VVALGVFVCPRCGQRYGRAGYCPADGNQLLGTEVGRYRQTPVAEAFVPTRPMPAVAPIEGRRRIGVIVGAGASLWASQFVTTLLYGLEPRDPRTLVQAAAVLAAVGALAGWLPAHRASRIDPAEVLRDS